MSNAGRKSKYHTHVEPRLETIKAWRRNGLTETTIRENLSIGHNAWNRYKVNYGELRESLNASKEDADAQVVNSLYKLANGFEYEEVKIIIDELGRKKIEKTKKYFPPNPNSNFFYLVNRCSKDWQSIQNIRIANPDGTPLNNTINIGIQLAAGFEALPADQKLSKIQENMKLIGNVNPRLIGMANGG